MNINKTKIFLSDPQILFREGIHFILSGEDDIEVTGEATNNEDALALIEANPPHIIILNNEDKKVSGPETIQRVKKQFPFLSAILTIDKKDEEQLFEAIKSGAVACLTKDADPEHLLHIIRDISQGALLIIEELLTPEMAAKVLSEFEDTKSLNKEMDHLMAVLAPKEMLILTNIAAGSTLEQVTAKMNMDAASVRNHLKLIVNKLVTNDQTRIIISTIQYSLAPGMAAGGPTRFAEAYLTREEFTRFKDTLAKRLKDVVGKTV